MDTENKLPLSKILENIAGSIFRLTSEISELAVTEAKLARQSAIKVTVIGVLLFFLSISTWICLQGLLILFLVSLEFTLLASLSIVTGVNVLLMVILGLIVFKLKDDFSFKYTRKHLSNTKRLFKG